MGPFLLAHNNDKARAALGWPANAANNAAQSNYVGKSPIPQKILRIGV
jgi:hypothetical protein